MLIGIDASNLRGGGGLTHLIEVLNHSEPSLHGFSKIIIWAGKHTLDRIENKNWIIKKNNFFLDRGLLLRSLWQKFFFPKIVQSLRCDVIFVPGGTYLGRFHPVVTMSRNMLPFERSEIARFGFSLMTLKLIALRWTQTKTFKKVDGLIFLNDYAKKQINKKIKNLFGTNCTISHGVDERFKIGIREQFPIQKYTSQHPFRILYVSIVNFYKHQWHVVDAISSLRSRGIPVFLEMVGPSYPPALKRLKDALLRFDPGSHFARYYGPIPYENLHELYVHADMVLFASSCENMPNILLEGMASGLPVASSNRGPMPEMLGDAGVYFDPEKPNEIASAIKKLLDSPELRSSLSQKSFARACSYSWHKCADETFRFLADVASSYHKKSFLINS